MTWTWMWMLCSVFLLVAPAIASDAHPERHRDTTQGHAGARLRARQGCWWCLPPPPPPPPPPRPPPSPPPPPPPPPAP
ncbi:hypothetical protein M427DRAFT_56736 [Gonapodya prolifera JEL478]|uniref:Uncharacterized protein n=1 Tax=Gonapodya prolifera (strain JEL478) TaxID=1344416 RepID=A0A139AG19_GONPJ|nr:hypothetical protein M427DRAFT_56736 [Gonapodya prolifera JEL478]|eukprot:KXS15375.1 hypothetical protein M427DRAFT_56736 [Gonapodya prolifera JEL478]